MSNLDRYVRAAESATGYRRTLGHVSALAGRPLLGYSADASAPPRIEWGIGTAAGAVAGGLIGAKHGHWLLGAMSGGSVFTNAPALLKPATRREAFWNLAQTHGGVFVSLAMQNKPGVGFALGYIAVGVARYLYGGSEK